MAVLGGSEPMPSTMPSVMQVSSPSALTRPTISSTTARSFSRGLRQAAPMQKRLAPASFAALACSTTFSISSSFSLPSPVA